MSTIDLPARDQVLAGLRRVRWTRALGSFARSATIAVLAVALAQGAVLGWLAWRNAGLVSAGEFTLVARIGLVVCAGAVLLAAVVAWWRHRALAATVAGSEAAFPDLGRAMSTGLEIEANPTATSPSIRQALWGWSNERLEAVGWKRVGATSAALVWLAGLVAAATLETVAFRPDGALAALVVPPPPPPIAGEAATPVIAHQPVAAPGPGSLTAGSLTVARAVAAASVSAAAPAPAKPAWRGRLTLDKPSGNVWTTAVETLEVTIGGDSSAGIDRLRLVAAVDELTPVELAVSSRVAPGTVSAGSVLRLGDLAGVSDFTVIAVSAQGETIGPDGSARHLVSPVRFIQVMPYEKSAPSAGGMSNVMGDTRLLQLIEAQRLVQQGTWQLAQAEPIGPAQVEAAAPASVADAATEAARHQVPTGQGAVRQTTMALHPELVERATGLSANAGPQADAAFARAEQAMAEASAHLDSGRWRDALPQQTRSQQALVEVQRLLGEALRDSNATCPTPRPVATSKPKPKPNTPPPPPAKPQVQPLLPTPQVVMSAAESQLAALAKEQAALNADADRLARARSGGAMPSDAANQAAALSLRQTALADATAEAARARTTEARAERDQRTSTPGVMGPTGSADARADARADPVANLLDQAVALQQANARTLLADPGAVPRDGEQAADLLRQADAAAEAANRSDGAQRLDQAMDQASEAAAKAEPKASTEALSGPARDALANLAGTLDRLAQAAKAGADAGTSSTRAAEALGQAAEAAKNQAWRSAQGRATDSRTILLPLAEALREDIGPAEHRARLAAELAALRRQAAAVSSQVARDQGLNPASRAWLDHLDARRNGLDAELAQHLPDSANRVKTEQAARQALAAAAEAPTTATSTPPASPPQPATASTTTGSGTKPGAGNIPGGPGSAADRPTGEAGLRPDPSGSGPAVAPTSAEVVRDLTAWITAAEGVQRELGPPSATAPTDWLTGMGGLDAPREYRPSVDRYFDRLSREK